MLSFLLNFQNNFSIKSMDDKKLIWHEKFRREVFKTPVFAVTERISVSPDGTEGVYIVNEAPDWVIVIPDDGENFLMVRQWRHGEKSLSIEFPGGVIDKGEVPLEAAKRELLEETGATAKKSPKRKASVAKHQKRRRWVQRLLFLFFKIIPPFLPFSAGLSAGCRQRSNRKYCAIR